MTTPTYTPNNLPFGWRWHSVNGVAVDILAANSSVLMGEVKLVSADGKGWYVRAHLYNNPKFRAVGQWRTTESLGNFESKQAAIEALIARHVQHKLEGSP